MITQQSLDERQLDQLYDWVDSLILSKPKKNISRDFSDATMMAQTIYTYYPKVVELHNYPSTNSVKAKLINWKTLNNKVLSKIGLELTQKDCVRLSSSLPMAIEPVLLQFKNRLKIPDKSIQSHHKIHENYNIVNEEKMNTTGDQLKKKSIKQKKLQELRTVLEFINQRIISTKRNIANKDSHIKEINEILSMKVDDVIN